VSESGFTSKQRKKVLYGREKHRNGRNKEQNDRKGKKKVKRKRAVCAATLSDFYPSTCNDPKLDTILKIYDG